MNNGTIALPRGLELSRPPLTARSFPPKGWEKIEVFEVAGTYSFRVPENVWSLALHVNGGGGNSLSVSTNNSAPAVGRSGGGGGFAFGVLNVFPGQVLSGIVVGGAQGTSSVAGLLTATGATLDSPGSGLILSPQLRHTFTANGQLGIDGASGGRAGSLYDTSFQKPFSGSMPGSGLTALVNRALSGRSGVTGFHLGGYGEDGQDGGTGRHAAVANLNVVPVNGGHGGILGNGGSASGGGGTTVYQATGGQGGYLGGGGAVSNSASGAGAVSGTGGRGGNGGGAGGGVVSGGNNNSFTGNTGGQGLIIVAWTPGY